MAFKNQTKTLLAVGGILLLIFLLYQGANNAIINDGEVALPEEENVLPENIGEEIIEEDIPEQQNLALPREDMVKHFPQRDYAPPESDWLKQKFNDKNKANRGYKRSNYSGALRGNLGPSDWEDYYAHNNNVIGNSQTGENDKFLPIDETNGGYAVFKSKGRATCGSNQNCEPEDLFDVDKYLPQEVNDDWWETPQNSISVKNRHLINITKPIGINTIGTSLKNSSYDIRAEPANPKFVVSPWKNTSIEPGHNIKPLF